MTKLIQEKCVPCESDIPPMKKDEIAEFLKNIPEWKVVKKMVLNTSNGNSNSTILQKHLPLQIRSGKSQKKKVITPSLN